jgi:hypothetical protein
MYKSLLKKITKNVPLRACHVVSMKMLSQEFSFSEARTGLLIGGINLWKFWLLCVGICMPSL